MKIVLLALVCKFAACHSIYQLIKHNDDQAARCLDGSPSAFYLSVGTVHKFVLFFQGGGMCSGSSLDETISDCLDRSKTALGSSSLLP